MKVEKHGNTIVIESDKPTGDDVEKELLKMKKMVEELQGTIDILLGE